MKNHPLLFRILFFLNELEVSKIINTIFYEKNNKKKDKLCYFASAK